MLPTIVIGEYGPIAGAKPLGKTRWIPDELGLFLHPNIKMGSFKKDFNILFCLYNRTKIGQILILKNV